MRVTIKQSFGARMHVAFRAGEVLDVPHALGARWIKSGHAVAATEDDMPQKETQQKPAPPQVPSKVEQAERAVKPQPEKRTR